MSLVLKLQKKCLDKNEILQDLLREALVISTKLKLADFKQWINYELKGYHNLEDENIPDYREVNVELKFWNPYHGWKPAYIKDKKISELLTLKKIAQPVGELADIYQNSDGMLQISLSNNTKLEIMKMFSVDLEPAQIANKTQIFGILDQVRNILLEWTLKLEEDGILGSDDLIFSEKEKEAAKSIHIENFYGVMGDIDKLSNFSTGKKSINTYNENNLALEIDKLIKEIQKLQLQDTKEIIIDLENSKTNPEKAKKVLGGLLTRGAEVSSITSTIIGILGLFS